MNKKIIKVGSGTEEKKIKDGSGINHSGFTTLELVPSININTTQSLILIMLTIFVFVQS